MTDTTADLGPISPVRCTVPRCPWAAYGIPDQYDDARAEAVARHLADEHAEMATDTPSPLTDTTPTDAAGPDWRAVEHAEQVLAQVDADALATVQDLDRQCDARGREIARLRAENEELAAELGARDEKARKRWIKAQEKQLGIRYADFRAGRWEMDLAMGREMAAAYVAMAKTMLGDAPNYSETKLEFDVKIAESPETYTLVVQRHAPGALTPHEARQRAEAEAQRLRAERDERTQLLVDESADRERAQAERDQARAELVTARAAGYRQAADHATEQVALHGADADAEMLLVFLQHGAELRERFAATQTTDAQRYMLASLAPKEQHRA